MQSKCTGPRTLKGKQRSRLNSARHGILCSVALLNGESQKDFATLLRGLNDVHQPEGAHEELCVSKLAILYWRYRRFLIAEGAEIGVASGFVEWERGESDRQESYKFPPVDDNRGLLQSIANPLVLERCLELLLELKEHVEKDGFGGDFTALLAMLFGDPDEEPQRNWRNTLLDSYGNWWRTSKCSAEERQQSGYPSPKGCVTHFLQEVDQEIRRLESYQNQQATISANKSALESVRLRIPEAPHLDRLLRYEASVSREIERTISLLWRLQEMRRERLLIVTSKPPELQ